MIRSFLGIAIPDAVADDLVDLQENLPGARWTAAENFHLTVCFLGEQPRNALEDLDASLRGAPPRANFEIRLEGVGAFGAPEPRLAYAGVVPSEALTRLHAVALKTARELDIEADGRKYAPHVTLARWGRREVRSESLAAWISANSLFRATPFEAGALTLFRSTLTKNGPIYEPMADYPFAA